MSSPIRVMSVEDNELVAEALGRKLSGAPEFQWLGWASTQERLAEMASQLRPDVICMDLNMPGQDAFEMLDTLRAVHPAGRVLILTGHVSQELVRRAVEAGVRGYLSKAEESRVIVESIRRVAAGEFVLGRVVGYECDPGIIPGRKASSLTIPTDRTPRAAISVRPAAAPRVTPQDDRASRSDGR